MRKVNNQKTGKPISEHIVGAYTQLGVRSFLMLWRAAFKITAQPGRHSIAPPRVPTPHDILHLHLMVETDPKETQPALNVHSLRHTNANLLIAGGADVSSVAGLLGHSQPSTTLDIYTHAFDKNKKAASQVLQEGLEI